MLFALDICVNKKAPATHSVHWGLKFSQGLQLKGCEIRLHYSNKNSEMLLDEEDVGNEETDFRTKNLLSWQNILSNRQIAADIEEK